MKFGNIISTIESLESTDQTPVEVAENETELVEGTAETEELGNQVDAQVAAVDTADESIDSLVEASDVVASGEGDLTSTEVLTTEALLSSINQSLGLDKAVATTECYQGMSRAQLVATLEDKKEGIFSKIFTAIKVIVQTAIGFITGLLRNKTLLGKYIDSLTKRASELEDIKPEGEVNSKFESAEAANKALSAIPGLMKVVQEASDGSKKLAEDLDKVVKEINNSSSGSIDSMDDKETMNSIKKVIPDAKLIDSSIVWAGGKILKTDNKNDKGEEMPFTLLKITDGKAVTSGKKLSKSEIISVLDKAKTALDSMKNLSGIDGKMKLLLNIVLNTGRVIGNGIALKFASKENKDKHFLSGTLRMMQMVIRTVVSTYTIQLPRIAFMSVKAAADYAKASM